MKKWLCAALIVLPFSALSLAADRDVASEKQTQHKHHPVEPPRFRIAATGGGALNILSGSPNANGIAAGFAVGGYASFNFAADHAIKLSALMQHMAFHSEIPGTAYDVSVDFKVINVLYDYYLTHEELEFYVGGGLGYVLQSGARTQISNNTIIGGLTQYPDQTGMAIQAQGGFNWNFNSAFYVPAELNLMYYTTTLAQGTPWSFILLTGIGVRF